MTEDLIYIINTLKERGQTLCVAESLTGGGLGQALTSVPGSSDVFLGGLIAYSQMVKEELLKVPQELIREHGVVSEEVAAAMAEGAQSIFSATWAIATTGVAGPGPHDGVAAGSVWLAFSGPAPASTELAIDGDRTVVRNATISSAISTFSRILRAS
ncbi:MAG: nicotinamide-nucleotide amidohydrolase family protein [Actinobacteria bacterium]|uniref:Unannotated protein n=1 Tax=freshwater metagenome TaxID=449393 RepID=A0A6J6TBG5_9ZZZZ|nr:CinA family protein [Actinomycetota bacterium]MSW46947.1 nicotinamide-nucleotide amidohydrolase family protein [Actinomycetota bacterium]MSX24371.1 nicotinamide-nucleotide amidohydrolase family protein [Actinomycetota bacterium]MSY46942.1 nicotinamide-nucleotide amidohydrolase family protein [Actinomycetota bacterium]MSY57009.1 nicotinamide-nucleotide amidohydrolase family protein [Actinomycetota bacterium]